MSQSSARGDAERARTVSRLRVLAVLRAFSNGCGVQEIAARTGLHPNTVRFHLERLEDDGLVSRHIQRRGEPGRPPLTYAANPVPDAGQEQRKFAQLAEVLAQSLASRSEDPVVEAIEAGRSWGQALAGDPPAVVDATDAISELVTTLVEVGFAPEVRAGEENRTLILQRHCPFLEVAQTHPDVVCSVHLGLMRGLLDQLKAPVTADRLIPFASPAGCEAHLTRD